MSSDLIQRLQGTYTVPVNDGAGPLDGKTEITRNFFMPPICHEAASRILELEAAIRDALMHLDSNYDIDENSMKDSDAARALRKALSSGVEAARSPESLSGNNRVRCDTGEEKVVKVIPPRQHGFHCRKVIHKPEGGYLHADDDDTPYNVDGCSYCGRCHMAI